MSDTDATPPSAKSLWACAVTDRDFCEALIADPLRALAERPDVDASPDQVKRLEAMSLKQREQVVRDLVREVTVRRHYEQWGDRAWTPDHDIDDDFDVMFFSRREHPARDDDDDDGGDEEAYVS